MSRPVTELLRFWLRRQIPETHASWIDAELAKIGSGSRRDLEIFFGLTPRRLDRAALDLTADDLAAAREARPDWDPRQWTVDETARILALLRFSEAVEDFADTFKQLCRTAEVGEAIALYRGLPLYPEPKALEWQVGEGLRTSMNAVFEAIAHRSPHPREFFSEHRWNHMVLKALFIGSSLAPIQGLDARANATLARILSDYARERWAAGRPVTPELWRCMGPFAAGDMVDDLARLVASKDSHERRAAALALSASPDDRAAAMLSHVPIEAMMVRTGSLSWDTLST
jgi:hypothetical protein